MEHLDKTKNNVEHLKSGVAFCMMFTNSIISTQNHLKRGKNKTLLAFTTV